MIRHATIEDVIKCEKLAEEFYHKRNSRGQFSGQYFVEYWGKIIDSGIGKILLRESDGKPMEALGYVVHPSFAGKPAVSTMFWYVTDEPQGLATGAILESFTQEAKLVGASEVRVSLLLDERLIRISSALKSYGFEVYEMVYLLES